MFEDKADMKKYRFRGIQGVSGLALGMMLMMAACNQEEATSPAATPASAEVAPPPFKTTTSMQDIMASLVDPSADALWESISDEWDQAGYRENRPATDEEWEAVRRNAIVLLESANLLLIRGRPVATPGRQLEDAGVPGVLDEKRIEQEILANRAEFDAFVVSLREVAEQNLTAIDARNVDALLEAGARLDEVCEACHYRFWYPDAQRPPSQ
jgi:hypothetical protein